MSSQPLHPQSAPLPARGLDLPALLPNINAMLRPILITGSAGFLGTALRRQFAAIPEPRPLYTYHDRAPESGSPSFHRLDVSDEASVKALFRELRPGVVIHAAATMNPEHFERSIVRGSESVARASKEIGAVLLQISSDMVFDGRHAPYDEEAAPSPITAYGRAKARAETAVLAGCHDALIIRTSLLYSLHPVDPRTQRDIDRLERGQEVVLFTDERRSAAEVHDVAGAIAAVAAMAARDRSCLERVGEPRTVHLAGPAPVTRWELGSALLAALGISTGPLRAGTISGSGLTRPRDLTLRCRVTPPEWHAGIRPLTRVLQDSGFDSARPDHLEDGRSPRRHPRGRPQ